MASTKFNARCCVPHEVPVQDLTAADEIARADLPFGQRHARRVKGEYVARVPHTFETTDRGLFENHMRELHGVKPGHCLGGGRLLTPQPRGYRRPALRAEGRPFDPTGLQLGATVTWIETVDTEESYYDEELARRVAVKTTIERTGQVWSPGPPAKSAWVIPEEPHEDESAVLLVDDGSGGLRVHQRIQREPARSTTPRLSTAA
jgi:hypothetical protein